VTGRASDRPAIGLAPAITKIFSRRPWRGSGLTWSVSGKMAVNKEVVSFNSLLFKDFNTFTKT